MEVKQRDRERIPQDTSPRTKKEKRKDRESIQDHRRKSAKELSQKLEIPNITDYVTLTSKQQEELASGDLQISSLEGKQRRGYKAFERKVTEQLEMVSPVKSPKGKASDSKLASSSPVKDGGDEKRKAPLHSTEQSPLTPTGKSTPRIESEGGTPRMKGVPGTPTAVLNWPRNPPPNLLRQKIRLQQQRIAGLKQQLAAEKGELERLEQKLDRVTMESPQSSRTARHPSTLGEHRHDLDPSNDRDALIERLIPSDPYRKQ